MMLFNRYDTGLRYDTNNRYDMAHALALKYCVEYELILTPIDPGMEIPEDLQEKVAKIIEFIQPIHAKMKPIFIEPMKPSDVAEYGIPQQLYMALESERESEYIMIHYDAHGNIIPSDEAITFDDDSITFDDTSIKWSTIKK